jgi:hypothetical protein
MVEKALDLPEFLNVDVRAQRRSVGVKISNTEITFDIVPALAKENGGYLIADRKLDAWIHTDPEAALMKVTAANKASDGHLVPLIKVAKAWNLKIAKEAAKKDERGDLIKPFKSFHLEVLCYGFKVAKPFNLRDSVKGVFCYLRENWSKQLRPPGGGVSDSLYAYLHEKGANKHPHDLGILLENAARLATEAKIYEYLDPEYAHDCWSQLLGAAY